MLHPLTQNPWQIDTDRESGPVSLSHLHQLDPVSYTHLDVYKRQIQYLAWGRGRTISFSPQRNPDRPGKHHPDPAQDRSDENLTFG